MAISLGRVKNRKNILVTLIILSLIIVLLLTGYLYTRNRSDHVDTGIIDQNQSVELDGDGQVVLEDIETDSIDKIKDDFKEQPELQFSQLYGAGSTKQYVERYDEALPYYIAAAEMASDNNLKKEMYILIIFCADKSGDEKLKNEFQQKADKIDAPEIKGSSQES